MAAAPGAAGAAGEPPPAPSFDDILCHSHSSAFAVLCAATSRVRYLSPNAAVVLGVEPDEVTGCVAATDGRRMGRAWRAKAGPNAESAHRGAPRAQAHAGGAERRRAAR